MSRSHIPFDDWLLSGRQIFLAEGVDYHDLAGVMKNKLQGAAKRRGLRVATKTVFEPPGFVFQAYLPGKPRPQLGDPTQPVTKKSHVHLYCRTERCDHLLRPVDGEFCVEHS